MNEIEELTFTCYCNKIMPTVFPEGYSTYECLSVMLTKINEVIESNNGTVDAIEELQALYVELKDYVDNYFEDLNVQDEINSKLDEMANDGTLDDILANYLGLIGMINFNSLADAKLNEDLMSGNRFQTLGYNTLNDGGKATYVVRDVTINDVADEATLIALYDVNLIAELVKDPVINIKQFGAVGDGVTDDTVAIQKALNYMRKFPREDEDISELYIPDGSYLITDTLTVTNGRWFNINGRGTIVADMDKTMLKLDSCMWINMYGVIFEQTNTGSSAECINIENSYIITFNKMYIEGGDKVVNIEYGNNLTFNNCSIKSGRINVYTTARGNNTNNMFINCGIENASEYQVYLGYTVNAYGKYDFINCYIEGRNYEDGLIYIKNGLKATFDSCYINQIYDGGYIVVLDGTLPTMSCNFKACNFNGTGGSATAFRQLTEYIKKGAGVDNYCILESGVSLYDLSDTYFPMIINPNPRKLNVYNLDWLLDTGGVLDGWIPGSAVYTLSDATALEGEQTIDITSGYTYKKLWLEKDVVYEVKTFAKNEGSGSARIQVMKTDLASSIVSVSTTNTSGEEISGSFRVDSDGFYYLLLRNISTTVASFCGTKLLSYKTKAREDN